MPRMSAEHRAKRDALIFSLFLASVSYRDIGAHHSIGLSHTQVARIVRAQLKHTQARRQLIADEAFDVALERLESLHRVAYAAAVKGDLHALAEARRIQAQITHLLMPSSTRQRAPGAGDDNVIPLRPRRTDLDGVDWESLDDDQVRDVIDRGHRR